jgi:hypothetical protein
MKTHLFLIVLVSTSVSLVEAQEKSRIQLWAAGGIVFPFSPGDFRDRWSEGLDVSATVSYQLDPKLSLQGTVCFDRFRFRDERDEELFADPFTAVDTTGGETQILSFAGELKVRSRDDVSRISVYVFLGGGLARVSVSDIHRSIAEVEPLTPFDLFLESGFFDPEFVEREVTIEGTSEWRPMTTLGGGVAIPVAQSLRVFVEGRYQITFTSDESTGHATIRGGIVFDL